MLAPTTYAVVAILVLLLIRPTTSLKNHIPTVINGPAWLELEFIVRLSFLPFPFGSLPDARAANQGRPFRLLGYAGETVVAKPQYTDAIAHDKRLTLSASLRKV